LYGEFDVARIPSLSASKITSGTLGVGLIPNLSASKITSGTLGVGLIPNLSASKITSGTLGVGLIPNLSASKITSGTLEPERISWIDEYFFGKANKAGSSSQNFNVNISYIAGYIKNRGWYIGEAFKIGKREDVHDYDLAFSRGTHAPDEGYCWISHSLNNADRLDFTGQHRSITKEKHLYSGQYIGYIVCASGEYRDLNSIYENKNRNIKINSTLPFIELVQTEYNKKCFGVISDKEDTNNRVYSSGRFNSSSKLYNGDKRIIINSLGEGSIWVCNINGSLENGDYITSSKIPGIGQKQNDDLLHNYTVAKITMDCDFEPKMLPLKKAKQIYIYTSNVVDDNEGSNIEPDDSNVDNKRIEISSNLNNVIDDGGNIIYEIQYDDNSNIIYEPEYEIKYIDIQGNILDRNQYNGSQHFKMAFVGCTYHCG
jgi:hypothetical protein